MALNNNLTSSNNVLQEEFLDVLLNDVPKESQLLKYCTKLRNLTRNTARIAVESNFVNVGFVDTAGAKPVTKAEWANVYVYRYELAGITVFADSELQDAKAQGRDLLDVVKTQFKLAAIEAMENAILFSTTIPNATSVYKRALDSGSIKNSSGNLYDDLLGKGGLRHLVLKDGYRPNVFLGGIDAEADLIGLTDSTGRPMYFPSIKGGEGGDMIGNIPFVVQPNEYWDEAKASFITGDFTKVAYSMGTEFNFDISNQATVTIEGQPVNLWERDMTALRFWFTFGFNTANPINRSNRSISEAQRSPFAILSPTA